MIGLNRSQSSNRIFLILTLILISIPIIPHIVPGVQARKITGEDIQKGGHDKYELWLYNGDEVTLDFQVTQGGEVDLYFLIHEEYYNYSNNVMFYPDFSWENVTGLEEEFTVDTDYGLNHADEYYIIVDNKDNARSSDAIPDGFVVYDLEYDVYSEDFPFEFWGLGFVFCCMIWAGMFVITIIIAIWVYRDAESRGENGVIWLLVVLVGGIIGLIIYLIVRSDKKPFGTGDPAGYYPPPMPPPYIPPPQARYPPSQSGDQPAQTGFPGGQESFPPYTPPPAYNSPAYPPPVPPSQYPPSTPPSQYPPPQAPPGFTEIRQKPWKKGPEGPEY